MSESKQAPNQRFAAWKRLVHWRIRFSLRTLLLAVLFSGGVLAIWLNWAPWKTERSWKVETTGTPFAAASSDRTWIAASGIWEPAVVLDSQSNKVLARLDNRPGPEPGSAYLQEAAFPGYTGWPALSPDGSQVALDAGGNKIHLFETRTWQQVRVLSLGDPFVESSPSNVGDAPEIFLTTEPPRLYTWTNKIRCLDAENSKELHKTETNPYLLDRVFRTPDGQHLLFREGPAWDKVKQLDMNLNTTATVAPEWNGWPGSVVVSNDGSCILTSESAAFRSLDAPDPTTELRNSETGEVLSRWVSHQYSPSQAERAPDGTSVVVVTSECAEVRDLPRGTVRARMGEAFDVGQKIVAAHYSPDGTRILTLGGDLTVALWDALDGEMLFRFPIQNEEVRLGHPVFLDDHRILLSLPGRVEVWSKQRPEAWWGMAWLAESWLSVLLFTLLLWSWARDCRTLQGGEPGTEAANGKRAKGPRAGECALPIQVAAPPAAKTAD